MNNFWHEQYKLLVFDEIDSTNSEAIRLAKTAPDNNYIILAKNQYNGRGKNGKVWHCGNGNFYVSLLINHNFEIAILPQLSFVTALAVYDTIKYLAPAILHKFIYLKWPNDVLIGAFDPAKISGILLESIHIQQRNYIVIGVGMNINHSPINIDQLTTNFREAGILIKEPEQILDIFMINFSKNFSSWQHEGFSKIRQNWLDRAYMLNKNISINDGNSKITGIFKDIDQSGAIRVQLDSGEVKNIIAGDVTAAACSC